MNRIKIPTSIKDVNSKNILGYGHKLAPGHPGFSDHKYKERRQFISKLANEYKVDSPIPKIHYEDDEKFVWKQVMSKLKELLPLQACNKYLKVFPLFEFDENEIPQLEDVSKLLYSTSGWKIRPVSGLLHPRDFLAGLAFKHFHTTQYVRHHSSPMYTPEPDVCHELIGHIPMLADTDFSDFVQAIGKASLGMDDATLWHITKVYWHTVEFGVMREGEDIKAYGAGILSSYGEMNNLMYGNPEIVSFDPEMKQPKMRYKDGYQRRYFRIDTLEDAHSMIEHYIRKTNKQC